MTLHTLHAGGRRICVCSMPDYIDPEVFVQAPAFSAKLAKLEIAGEPVWEGSADVRLNEPTTEGRLLFDGFLAERGQDIQPSVDHDVILLAGRLGDGGRLSCHVLRIEPPDSNS